MLLAMLLRLDRSTSIAEVPVTVLNADGVAHSVCELVEKLPCALSPRVRSLMLIRLHRLSSLSPTRLQRTNHYLK